MKKVLFFLVLIILLAFPFLTLAQNEEEIKISADAGESKKGMIGETIKFSARGSIFPEDEEVKILWKFGDGNEEEGLDVSHSYNKAGNYLVTLVISSQEQKSQDTVQVNIFSENFFLIADNSLSTEKLINWQNASEKQGIYLSFIQDTSTDPEYLKVENLSRILLDRLEELQKAKIIIIATAGNAGINTLSNLGQILLSREEKTAFDALNFPQKSIFVLTSGSFAVLARNAQSAYGLLNPQFIVLTKEEALPFIFSKLPGEEILAKLQENKIDYRLLGIHSQRAVTKLGPLNFMSYGINFLVNKRVPINSILLILMLPLIATLIAFARQIIGVKAFGIYTPSIITLSFFALGLKYGLLVFIVVLFSGTIFRYLLRRLHLLYLPRMALLLTLVSLILLILLGLGASFGKTGILALSVFPILIMVTMVEKFVAAQISKGFKTAFTLTLETLILAIGCYYLLNWESLRVLLLGFPELILFTIIINLIIGRWTGLRLFELIRFREIIRHVQPPKKK